MIGKRIGSLGGALMLSVVSLVVAAEPPVGEPQAPETPLAWLTNYDQAVMQAKLDRKMLLIYFEPTGHESRREQFESQALTDPEVRQELRERYVLLRVGLEAKTSIDGPAVRLLDDDSFAEMQGKPGVAIVDFVHRAESFYATVVSVFPLTDGRYYRFRPENLRVLVDLPPGTLTQRTMIFAVRTHPEDPDSTDGEADPVLMKAARNHSEYQADIGVQGHHHWESRFHSISSELPDGLTAQEVVAESWPGQGLLDACIDCVHSWRQSSGHWGAVRARQPRFGYDIRRGRNGVWYATGIFGNRH